MYIGKPTTEPNAQRRKLIQFPIIDEVSDRFSLLVSKIGKAIRGLDPDHLQDLKTCIEEKMKAKGIPLSLPSDANEVFGTLCNYWGFLNFELENEKLQNEMAAYEKLVQSKVETTLKECKNSNVMPEHPPHFETVSIRADVDPLSYSLYHILEMKDFLLHRVQLKQAFFAGWSVGSIILHFS